MMYGHGTGWRLDAAIASGLVAAGTTIHASIMSVFEDPAYARGPLKRYIALPSTGISVCAVTYLSLRTSVSAPAKMPWGDPFVHTLAHTVLVRCSCDLVPCRLVHCVSQKSKAAGQVSMQCHL